MTQLPTQPNPNNPTEYTPLVGNYNDDNLVIRGNKKYMLLRIALKIDRFKDDKNEKSSLEVKVKLPKGLKAVTNPLPALHDGWVYKKSNPRTISYNAVTREIILNAAQVGSIHPKNGFNRNASNNRQGIPDGARIANPIWVFVEKDPKYKGEIKNVQVSSHIRMVSSGVNSIPCEKDRSQISVTLEERKDEPVYVNPGLRMRVSR